ncbi:MAG: methionyl-tRNA formyltransferase [Candidatus Omnitrophica bacterium]|nr:methionyl-tRNA formyltransferase [Candidatus Omnitrophota bacterium]
MMNIVFFGSDDFSLASLNACLESSHQVVLAVTTPPQKQGRGLTLVPTPVQQFAASRRIPFAAPEDLKNDALPDQLRSLDPGLFVVASYGKFIPGRYLSIPSFAALNVHPSLLPLYRGSSPIQAPLLNGDRETGLSIIELARRLDAGDIFLQVRIPLDGTETQPILRQKLADLSHRELLGLLNSLPDRPLQRTPQDEARSTYAPKLSKEDGHLSLFLHSAEEIERRVRALQPWPGTFIHLFGERVAVLEARSEHLEGESAAVLPGAISRIESNGAFSVGTREGILKVFQLQPAGKKAMRADAYLNGRRLKAGAILRETPA